MELKNVILLLVAMSLSGFGLALSCDVIERMEAKNEVKFRKSIQSCKNLCLAFDDTVFVDQARFGGQTICYCEKEFKKIRFGVIDPGNN